MPQAQVQITDLPQAQALTGTESVPIVQDGVTVQTTTGAISGAGALNYLIIGGGGSGGVDGGGGGGAGGMLTGTTSLTPGTTYSFVIGAGGGSAEAAPGNLSPVLMSCPADLLS